MTPRVLVAHPNRQYSHQLALALAGEGILLQYITGLPAHRKAAWSWVRPFMRGYVESYQIPLPPKLVRHVFVAPVVNKLAHRLLPRRYATSLTHRADGWFDYLASRRLSQLRPDVVIGYENACLRMFQQAKRLGATTVLDAASFHHAWQDRFYAPVESPRAHTRITSRKDAEVRLADHIITVSEFARASYLDAGLPADRVTAVPLGADLASFSAQNRLSRPHNDPVRFVFVGQFDERKGADVLCAAIQRLAARQIPLRMAIIGNRPSTEELGNGSCIEHLGWMSHERLSKELPRHDVLVLPSRHDSFGMVVVEAMACGLAVIVSDHVGAKELVSPGVNGLVVPPDDVIALASAMESFVDNREKLPGTAIQARRAAERYGWTDYRRRVVRLIHRIANHGEQESSAKAEYLSA